MNHHVIVRWRNNVSGKLYEITGHAINTSDDHDGEVFILYKPDGGVATYAQIPAEFYDKFERVEIESERK